MPSVAQHARAHVDRVARRVAEEVLHQERHARERAVPGTIGPRLLRGRASKRGWMTAFSCGLQPLDARDRGVDQLERARVAAAHQLGLRGGVEAGEGVLHAADATMHPA